MSQHHFHHTLNTTFVRHSWEQIPNPNAQVKFSTHFVAYLSWQVNQDGVRKDRYSLVLTLSSFDGQGVSYRLALNFVKLIFSTLCKTLRP